MNSRQSTQIFIIRSILVRHCGEKLTADNVELILGEIENEIISGSTLWAFAGIKNNDKKKEGNKQ